jgi:hypothetical protein
MQMVLEQEAKRQSTDLGRLTKRHCKEANRDQRRGGMTMPASRKHAIRRVWRGGLLSGHPDVGKLWLARNACAHQSTEFNSIDKTTMIVSFCTDRRNNRERKS